MVEVTPLAIEQIREYFKGKEVAPIRIFGFDNKFPRFFLIAALFAWFCCVTAFDVFPKVFLEFFRNTCNLFTVFPNFIFFCKGFNHCNEDSNETL